MMLFLISSAPDTKEFQTAFRTAKEIKADICLLQNAVHALIASEDKELYVLSDDLKLRGINENEISGKPVDYSQLIDLMTEADKVAGLF
jgi:sulfur relay protein TusB/DsrH